MLMAALIFLLVVILSVATVLLYISGMSSKSNGWVRLAELYRSSTDFPERRLGFLTTTLNGYVLQHLMVVGLAPEGLALRPILLFRAFHPPLFIPWEKIATTRKQNAFGVSHELSLGEPGMRIEWSDATHRQIAELVPATWNAARAALALG